MTHERGGRSVAIFDLGGVLLDWNPRHLYRKLFNGDDAAMEDFLANVCTTEWNERQDAGRTFAEGTRELLPRHADKVELIEAWGKRFGEMIPGPIDGTVDVLSDLRARKVPLYGVSNWSAETFPPQRARFPFLSWFDGHCRLRRGGDHQARSAHLPNPSRSQWHRPGIRGIHR